MISQGPPALDIEKYRTLTPTRAQTGGDTKPSRVKIPAPNVKPAQTVLSVTSPVVNC